MAFGDLGVGTVKSNGSQRLEDDPDKDGAGKPKILHSSYFSTIYNVLYEPTVRESRFPLDFPERRRIRLFFHAVKKSNQFSSSSFLQGFLGLSRKASLQTAFFCSPKKAKSLLFKRVNKSRLSTQQEKFPVNHESCCKLRLGFNLCHYCRRHTLATLQCKNVVKDACP